MDGSGPNFFPTTSMLLRALVAATLTCAGLPACAETGAVMTGIESMTIGSKPAGFTFARTGQGGDGEWIVTADATAAGGRAIEQVSTERTDYRFPLAVYDGVSATNVNVTVMFRAVEGRIDQAAGIAVRLRDADNYYVARANALEDNVRFYRVVKGRREQLASANVTVAPNQWHVLVLRAEADRFTVTYDGTKAIEWDDETFKDAGKVGVWTKADSVTLFDDFTYGTRQ